MTSLAELRPINDATTQTLEIASRSALLLSASNEMPLRPQDEALLQDMEMFRFGVGDSRVGWMIGSGPLVILVHGYGGRGVQMARLAQTVSTKGFRCAFFDAGGHGASRKEKIGFFTFMNDVRDLLAHLQEPVHALIGHSAGALAMMRARALYGVSANRYAAISAPVYPYVPLNSLRQNGVPETAVEAMKLNLADQFQMTWSELVSGACFAPDNAKDILLIYDRQDPRVQHEDADQIAVLWSHSDLLKTDGHGHNKILTAPETLRKIADWIEKPL